MGKKKTLPKLSSERVSEDVELPQDRRTVDDDSSGRDSIIIYLIASVRVFSTLDDWNE